MPRLPQEIRACLFDMDGVLTDTARVHVKAWKETFDAYLKQSAPQQPPFDAAKDYLNYVDGKPREDGVRDFLASRGLDTSQATVDELAERKNKRLLELIDKDGVAVFDGSVRFVKQVREAGIHTAVVSSSANTAGVLESAGLTSLFERRVDGVVIVERGLQGKPAPDSFLYAAEQLGVEPQQAAVFEDALSGVEAGRRGNFGLVVGVDRGAGREQLARHGADVVVGDLSELELP